MIERIQSWWLNWQWTVRADLFTWSLPLGSKAQWIKLIRTEVLDMIFHKVTPLSLLLWCYIIPDSVYKYSILFFPWLITNRVDISCIEVDYQFSGTTHPTTFSIQDNAYMVDPFNFLYSSQIMNVQPLCHPQLKTKLWVSAYPCYMFV